MKVKRLFQITLLAALVASCGHKEQEKSARPVEVEAMTVGGTSAGAAGEYVGTVTERTATVLSFEVAGNVSSLRVDEGDHVKRGQLLGTVTPNTLQDAHYATTVALKQARDAYNRMKPLHKEGVISDMKWVDVESKLRQAEAAERIAKEQLGHTGLYAPAAGVISARSVEPGMNVIPGQQVFKLVDISSVDIKISVPENEIAGISKGAKAGIVVGAIGNAAYTATVTEKGVSANPLSHTYDVKLTLSNPGGRLMPGMVCKVSLASGAVSEQVIVPLNTIELDTDNTRFVWTVENGRAARRVITVGNFAGNGVEVVSGLKPGDRVITVGAQKVSQGMKVEIKK